MNGFNLPFQDLNIEMKCVATNEYGKKDEIGFKFPRIVNTATRHCYGCKSDYEDEEHLLPSLKSYWLGCPKCSNKIKDIQRKNSIQNFLLEKQAEGNKMMDVTEDKEIKSKYKNRK